MPSAYRRSFKHWCAAWRPMPLSCKFNLGSWMMRSRPCEFASKGQGRFKEDLSSCIEGRCKKTCRSKITQRLLRLIAHGARRCRSKYERNETGLCCAPGCCRCQKQRGLESLWNWSWTPGLIQWSHRSRRCSANPSMRRCKLVNWGPFAIHRTSIVTSIPKD